MVDPATLRSPKNLHFFKPLLPGFHSHIDIPLKFFSKHIEGRNKKNTVELKSDACEKTWKAKIEGRRLTGGWKEFVGSHDFRIGDFVVFRHQGDLVFHVTGFGPSCCEIQYVHDNIRNLSMGQNLKAESDSSCFVAPITYSNLREDRLFLPQRFVKPDGLKKGSNKIVLMDKGLSKWTLNLRFRESTGTFYMRTGWRSFCHQNGLEPGDFITFKLESNKTKTPLLHFSSSESKNVYKKPCKKVKRITGESSQRGSSSLSENRFVKLTVTPASLKYLSSIELNKMENAGGQKITMLDKHGVEWLVNLLREKGNMRLGSGLKEFLKDIGVKAYKSFVLELVWEDTTIPPIFNFCSKVKT